MVTSGPVITLVGLGKLDMKTGSKRNKNAWEYTYSE